ncbi:MAG: PspA/IM30 family protein [Hyphomicrobiaceae bacterium]
MTSEGLMSRVRRLVLGGFGSLVDAAEAASPETVMKEAIREVDRAAAELRDRLGATLANRHHASKRLDDARRRHGELADRLKLAVAEGRDDLAEAVIASQLDLEAQTPVLEAALREADAEAKEIEGYIAALAGRKREMESDLATYVATRQAAPGQGPGTTATGGPSVERRVEQAGTAFDRVLRQATGVGGSAAANRDTAEKLAELERLERAGRIRERLAAAKGKS